jgi:hypothetical protein
MKLDDFLAGIAILRTHTENDYPLDANHDEILFSIDSDKFPLTFGEMRKLSVYGWGKWQRGEADVWLAYT